MVRAAAVVELSQHQARSDLSYLLYLVQSLVTRSDKVVLSMPHPQSTHWWCRVGGMAIAQTVSIAQHSVTSETGMQFAVCWA
jgi:hypothetical protein